MSLIEECETLTKAFSGIGVDEKSIVSIVGKWQPEQTNSFRKGSDFFAEDGHYHAFHKWDNDYVKLLELEFSRLREAVLLWTMHPWERDARLIKESLVKGPKWYAVIIEIACTRSSEELLGARKAYHSLFDRSIEEDVAHRVTDTNRNLLVALVSSYRYEGPKVNEETAKADAKILANAIKSSGNELEKNAEVLRILTTRSKPCLKAIFKHYKELYGKNIDEDLNQDDLILRDTIICLGSPHIYFSKVLDRALNVKADEYTKDGLTRVVITRADIDIKGIKEEYQKLYGVALSQKIEEIARGSYKDFLLTLVARGN
ncbi:Annexin d4 [Thalictrum thalictroides]|uniref:Annexin d4 n=1 Tax=Thalictrum thalictroides TaxID=46969 RepID=A0A7J6WHS6_THATH|nr:Annexin d4 [Thalictrum thalictroides]